jgi:hypothetical protein
MSKESTESAICGAQTKDGSPCQRAPMENQNRCHWHGGKSTGPKSEEGKKKVRMNGKTHGLRSDPINLLEDLRQNDEEAYAWVQDKFESYLNVAPFPRESAHADQLLQICVREYSIWKASGIQIDEGIITQEKKVAGDGVIVADVENPANKSLDRMERTVVKRLDKLGVMPSPEAQKAEAQEDLASLWASELRE